MAAIVPHSHLGIQKGSKFNCLSPDSSGNNLGPISYKASSRPSQVHVKIGHMDIKKESEIPPREFLVLLSHCEYALLSALSLAASLPASEELLLSAIVLVELTILTAI